MQALAQFTVQTVVHSEAPRKLGAIHWWRSLFFAEAMTEWLVARQIDLKPPANVLVLAVKSQGGAEQIPRSSSLQR